MSSNGVVPRPFLKWVGGKGQLLPELWKRVELAGDFGNYYEPFLGGGALFFDLVRRGVLAGREAYLSDVNEALVETWQAVRDDVDKVIVLLKAHSFLHNHQSEPYKIDHYYATRSTRFTKPAARAARVIYLNKTCFNGLYRENKKGEFNVPMGAYKNPAICDEENLRAVSAVLQGVTIEGNDFSAVLDTVQPNDLVYFDPPYHPVSGTSSFTEYSRGGFGEAGQQHLAMIVAELCRRDVKVLLSNSDTAFIRDLYGPGSGMGLVMERVEARRSVNSKGGGRGKVGEVLVRNFLKA